MWFRNDLRIEDNPAWSSATREHDEVVPVVVLDRRLLDAAGPFRRAQWLASVRALSDDLAHAGGSLTVLDGDPAQVLAPIAKSADKLVFNSATSAWGTSRDERVVRELGLDRSMHWGTLVTVPGTVLTTKGTVSRVFTPFSKVWRNVSLDPWPDPGDSEIVRVGGVDNVELPAYDTPTFPSGTSGAHDQLDAWLDLVDSYPDTRNLPAIRGTSRLSAALRHGTISPRTVLDIVGTTTPGREAFVRQLAWRDWYAHLLLEFPELLTTAIKAPYDSIKWRDDAVGLEAWKEGRTGYPIVDAGMRQLAATGWMHNRVRMITASFLVKDLLIDWREGERWFRWLLADAEPSQNGGNWQWVAGTGPDAAPYFRVFNPVTQSRKFDADGEYIRSWVPEIAALDSSTIHAPWETPPLELAASGVVLGDTYPEPIVDHGDARERALSAYKKALGN